MLTLKLLTKHLHVLKKKNRTILFSNNFALKERKGSGPFLSSIITVHGTYISAFLCRKKTHSTTTETSLCTTYKGSNFVMQLAQTSEGAAQHHNSFFLLLILHSDLMCIFKALKNYDDKLMVNLHFVFSTDILRWHWF